MHVELLSESEAMRGRGAWRGGHGRGRRSRSALPPTPVQRKGGRKGARARSGTRRPPDHGELRQAVRRIGVVGACMNTRCACILKEPVARERGGVRRESLVTSGLRCGKGAAVRNECSHLPSRLLHLKQRPQGALDSGHAPLRDVCLGNGRCFGRTGTKGHRGKSCHASVHPSGRSPTVAAVTRWRWVARCGLPRPKIVKQHLLVKERSVADRRRRLHRWSMSSSCDECGENDSYLVDPASSHMLVSKIKPCMSKYKLFYTVKLRMAH